jgi:L-iditol 2-dehydrogenase
VRAYVIESPGRPRLSDVDDPVPGPGEVLVAPAAVGICGSDLELLDGRRPAGYVRYPVVPGHEWAGHVVADAPGLPAGTPVVAEGVRACGVCARCAEGRTNLCAGPYAETGFTHPGALADRVVVPVGLVHPLPTDRPIATAALIEPAACVATGLLEVGVPPAGARLAVVGDGPLGLLAVALLRLSQPADLVLVGHRPERTALAPALGARVDPGFTGADLVVEASNSPAGAAAALRMARRGGTVVLLGISGTGRPALDPDAVVLDHLRVQGVFAASRAAWRWVVGLYATGLFDPAVIVTHRFGLDEVDRAFAVLADRASGALKVLVEPSRERS